MKEIWTKNWKKALIWVSGYFSVIAFAIVGGYAIVKGQDEELKRTAKHCFVVVLVFMALDILTNILSSINGFAYSTGFSTAIRWIDFLVFLAKIAVYATMVVMSIFTGKENSSSFGKNQLTAQEGKPAASAEGEKETEQKVTGEGSSDD